MNSIQTPRNEQEQITRSLWRNRDFLLLWSGQVVSTLGSNISSFALPLLVLALTHSPVQAGFVTAMQGLPYFLFSLPAGALVDRWNRKRVMIYCDVLRWLTLGSIPLSFALGQLSLVQLYIVAFVEGTVNVLFTLAQISALPHVVPPAHLARAYALDNTTEYLGPLLGPALGALIIGLVPLFEMGAVLAYLADSISYFVSVLSLLFIRVSFQAEYSGASRRGLHKEIAEGLRFLWGHRLMRAMMLLTTAVNFLQSPLDLLLIVLAQNTLHLDVRTIGLMLSAGGVGGVLGSLVASRLSERLRAGRVILSALVIWTLAALALAAFPWPPALIAARFLIGLTWPAYGVTVVAYRLTETPDELRGRVNSAFRFFSFGSEPLGKMLAGGLLAVLSAQSVLGLIAAAFVLILLIINVTEVRKA